MKRGIALIAVAAFLWALPVNGALITTEIEAVVDGVSDNYGNFLEGKINKGDLITGTYTYDTDTPDSNPLANVGDYEHYAYPYGFSLTVGGLDFMTDTANTNFLIEIVNDDYDDFYLVRSYSNLPLSNGTSVNNIAWYLNYNYEDALLSTELPITAPILDRWAHNFLDIEGGPDRIGFVIQAHVTSAVVIPEPATVILFSFAGLIFVRRAKK